MSIVLNKNSFCRLHIQPLFASIQTLARIDFLRQGERLVDFKGTHNVKNPTKNKTKHHYFQTPKYGFYKKDLITLHVLVNSTSNKKNKEGKNISNNTDHLVNNQCVQTTER